VDITEIHCGNADWVDWIRARTSDGLWRIR